MEISIARALIELKLTNKKIEQKTAQLTAGYAVQPRGISDAEKAIAEQSSKLQSVRDLIKRRNDLKLGIVKSNAEASVTIGDKVMTVAAAIERKTSIALDISLARQIRETYFQAKSQYEAHNTKIEAQADKQAETALQSDSEADKGEAYEAIRKVFIKNNQAKLIAIDEIEKLIEKMQDDIDTFEADVDIVLTESNTKTMITI